MNLKQKLCSIPPIRMIVYVSCLIMIGIMIYLTVYRSVTNTLTENLVVMIGNILLWVVPFVAKPIFKEKISDGIYLFFVIYSFFASFLGTILTFYENIWWYDMLIHTLFGYVGCIIGLFFACKLADIDHISPVFAIFFIFAVSMMFSALWEIFEFLGDQWLNNNAQGDPHWVDGILMRNVKDTMEDIICHTCGAIVFVLHYTAHVLSGKSLLMDTFKKDFSKGKKQKSASSETDQNSDQQA